MQEDKIILYIEDDPEARFLMADIIRYKGYIYLEASRGLEGIQLAEQHTPDLILIDLMLPDMQGYEVTTHLKTLPQLVNTPIIAITGATEKNVKEMVLAAGCDGFIPKPINVSEFVYKIEEFLSGHKENMEPEEERLYLQKYNIQLVSRLKKKILELETLNENLTALNSELFASKEELSHYNDRLFYLNSLTNSLRTLSEPSEIIRILPQKIIEGFQMERCALFEIEANSGTLLPAAAAGIPLSFFEKNKVALSGPFFHELAEEGNILWIKDPAEIVDQSLLTFSQQLGSSNFIIGNISHPGAHNNGGANLTDSTVEIVPEFDLSFSRKYLIFIDKGKKGLPFHTYEVRIIKSLLHSAAITYENILLHTQLIHLYKIKAEQAIRDEMTHMYNYRYFMQELHRETNRSKRFNTCYSLMMVDIDHFKKYNDANGHLEGDKALKLISRLMDQNTRTTDTVCRYGGEEFTIIMPGLKKSEAIMIAEKLRALIENSHFSGEGQEPCCKLTVSIGVASYPEDATQPDILLQLADSAMYKAKSQGRNQVAAS